MFTETSGLMTMMAMLMSDCVDSSSVKRHWMENFRVYRKVRGRAPGPIDMVIKPIRICNHFSCSSMPLVLGYCEFTELLRPNVIFLFETPTSAYVLNLIPRPSSKANLSSFSLILFATRVKLFAALVTSCSFFDSIPISIAFLNDSSAFSNSPRCFH